jgi:trehalose 6-phosphate synthase
VAANVSANDLIWVHDYHLMLVAQELRKRGVNNRLRFFLHIPFPPPDIFLKLPWRLQIIHALLEYDVLGFQTSRDSRNFIACVRKLVKEIAITNERGNHLCKIGNRSIYVGAYPISID